MQRRIGWLLLLALVAVVGLAGCGSDESTKFGKFSTETEEEARASKAYDDKINEEEGGASFGKKPTPGPRR